MEIGTGIAIAFIWVGVGLSAFGKNVGEAVIGVAFFAMLATWVVVGLS